MNNMRSDTKKSSSLIEALSNVAIGYGISFAANALILPQFGYNITVSDNLAIGAIFTMVSVARSYLLRRLFLLIWISKDMSDELHATEDDCDEIISASGDFNDDGVNYTETSIDFDELDYLLTDGPCAGQAVPHNYNGTTFYIPYATAGINPDLYTASDDNHGPDPMKVALYVRQPIKMGRNVNGEKITTRWSEWSYSSTDGSSTIDSYFSE